MQRSARQSASKHPVDLGHAKRTVTGSVEHNRRGLHPGNRLPQLTQTSDAGFVRS
jgi:hypothetical protein